MQCGSVCRNAYLETKRANTERVLGQLNGRTSTGARQAMAGLASSRQCLFQVSGFEHPKTADVLLGLDIRPVGEHQRLSSRHFRHDKGDVVLELAAVSSIQPQHK